MICFSDKDMPCSYQTANRASLRAQRKYLLGLRTWISMMILGALAAWMSSLWPAAKLAFCLLSSLLFVFTLFATLLLKFMSYEDIWYVGRAVAESIKTTTWAFCMGTERFPVSMPEAEMRERFLGDIRAILQEKGSVSLATDIESSIPEISKAMSLLRLCSVSEKIQAYMDCRVSDQRSWYAAKSKASVIAEERFFLAIFAIEILAIAMSVLSIYRGTSTSGAVGVLTAATSSLLAWLQIKKYQETGKAYEIASRELGFAEELGRLVATQDDLSKFVRDTETAISREHTLWVARRGVR